MGKGPQTRDISAAAEVGASRCFGKRQPILGEPLQAEQEDHDSSTVDSAETAAVLIEIE